MADELRLTCLDCGKAFKNRAHLANHEKVPHPSSDVLDLLRSFNASRKRTVNEGIHQPRSKRSKTPASQDPRNLPNSLVDQKSSDPCVTLEHSVNLASIDSERNSGSNYLQASGENSCCYGVVCDVAESESGAEALEGDDTERVLVREDCFRQLINNRQRSPDPSVEVIKDSGELRLNSLSAVEKYLSGPLHLPELLPRPSNYCEDLHSGAIPRDVYEFYKSFGDSSEILYNNLKHPSVSFHELPEKCRVLMTFCMEQRFSQGQIEKQYDLQEELDRINGFQELHPTSVKFVFSDSKSFASRVVLERKLLVIEQGWRRLHLVNGLGNHQVGVFIPIITVLSRVVQGAGGIESIQVFNKCLDDAGNRVYHSPMNADVVEKDCQYRVLPSRKAKKIFFPSTVMKRFFQSLDLKTLLSFGFVLRTLRDHYVDIFFWIALISACIFIAT